MGIFCKENIVIKNQDDFYATDKIITGIAFDIHNNIGRFADEKIYQKLMSEKCNEKFINNKREVEICVAYKDFLKSYKLYNEAVIFFLGGDENVIVPTNIFYNKKIIGKQKMQMLDNETVFHFSSIKRAFEGYEENIRRLISHTKIKAVQWININKRIITLKTI